jgi:very-short-patch-repair endonuclease
MKVNKKCETCGKEFSIIKSRKDKAKYCSRECQYTNKERQNKIAAGIKNLKKGKEVTCLNCGKKERVSPSRSKIYKFCSNTCAGEHRTKNKNLVKKTCIECSKEFYVQKYREESSKYCSKNCLNSSKERIEKILKTKEERGNQTKTFIDIDYIKNKLEKEKYSLLSNEYVNNRTRVRVKCNRGHEFGTNWFNLQRGNRCPVCNEAFSKLEKDLLNKIKKLYTGEIKENTRLIITPLELDIYIPEHKLAIEFCGLYWHNDDNKEKNYHRKKMNECNKKGIRLITIFEDEWLDKEEIVLSKIKQSLNLTSNRIYARNTEIKEITSFQANSFYVDNHTQGKTRGIVHFGLFYKGKLVQAASIGSPSRGHIGKEVLELKRMATKVDTTIIGGASKLLKYIKNYALNRNYQKLRSYCDLRWGTGNVYEKLGFTKVGETSYTPHYIKNNRHRFRNQSLRKTPEERLTGKTEVQLRKEQGYTRIFDCGHQTWDLLL